MVLSCIAFSGFGQEYSNVKKIDYYNCGPDGEDEAIDILYAIEQKDFKALKEFKIDSLTIQNEVNFVFKNFRWPENVRHRNLFVLPKDSTAWYVRTYYKQSGTDISFLYQIEISYSRGETHSIQFYGPDQIKGAKDILTKYEECENYGFSANCSKSEQFIPKENWHNDLNDALLKKEYLKAADFAERCLWHDPENTGRTCLLQDDYNLLGKYKMRNNAKVIISETTKLLKKYPNRAAFLLFRAQAYQSLEKNELALADFVSFEKLIPSTKTALDMYVEMGDYQKAITYFKEGNRPSEISNVDLFKKAQILRALKSTNKANAAFESLIERLGNSIALAGIYFSKGDYQRTVELNRMALDKGDNTRKSRLKDLAEAFIPNGQYKESERISTGLLKTENSTEDKIILLHLNIIAKRLDKQPYKELEEQLALEMKKHEANPKDANWSFDSFQSWIREDTTLPAEDKTFVSNLVTKVKKGLN